MLFGKKSSMKTKSRANLINFQRLPRIAKPVMIEATAPKIVSKVMCNHDKTQDMLRDSSKRASSVIDMSQETLLRARETLGTW